jgi:hypothetical protein
MQPNLDRLPPLQYGLQARASSFQQPRLIRLMSDMHVTFGHTASSQAGMPVPPAAAAPRHHRHITPRRAASLRASARTSSAHDTACPAHAAQAEVRALLAAAGGARRGSLSVDHDCDA